MKKISLVFFLIFIISQFSWAGTADPGYWFDVRQYGAVKAIRITDAAITNTDTTLKSASALFTSAHVGQAIDVWGAGAAGVVLNTTIASFTSTTEVELTAAAGTTVTGAEAIWGPANDTAISDAITAAGVGGTILIPELYRVTTGGFTLLTGQTVVGDGWASGFYYDKTDGGGSTQLFLISGAVSNIQIKNMFFRGRQDDLEDGANSGRWVSIECTNDKTAWSQCPHDIVVEMIKANDGYEVVWAGVEPGPVGDAEFTPYNISIRNLLIYDHEHPINLTWVHGSVNIDNIVIIEEGRIQRPLFLSSGSGWNISNIYVEGNTYKTPTASTGIATGINLSGWNHHINLSNIILNKAGEIVFSGTGNSDNFATTDVNTTTNVITVADVGYNRAGRPVKITTTDTLPAGLSAGAVYYVIPVSDTTIKLATSEQNARAGTAIAITSQGVGTHTITNRPTIYDVNVNNLTGSVYVSNLAGSTDNYARINLVDITIPDGQTFSFHGGGGFSFENLSSQEPLDIRGYDNLVINNGRFYANDNDYAIRLSAQNGTNLSLNNSVIYSKSGKRGILIDGGTHTGINVSNSRFVTGGGTAYGIEIDQDLATVTGLILEDNTWNTTNLLGLETATVVTGYNWNPSLKGRAVLVGGTVTVNTGEVNASDNIFLTRVVSGGTTGDLSIGTIVAGTSFVINSSSGTDTSTVYWEIRH